MMKPTEKSWQHVSECAREESVIVSRNGHRALTIASVMIMSFQPSLRNITALLMRTVKTARHMVTIVVHPTRLTTGPLLAAEIIGTRAANSWINVVSVNMLNDRPTCATA